MATFCGKFPASTIGPEQASDHSDLLFAEALTPDRAEPAPASQKAGNPLSPEAVRTVVLLPMSDRQISLFAEQAGVKDVADLLVEMRRQNAWTFARRPLDLAGLIAIWASTGRLGTRKEQHEANITTKLKDDPERPDRGVLNDDQARLGAERLALAQSLTRTRTIRLPDQSFHFHSATGVLDPAAVLGDWTELQRQTLLRRALFDPATYGRVRFHHRSVQEFLAARRLLALRNKGMPTRALLRLLFGSRYGFEVVFPSMRAIAAWLALWDDAVRRELIKREPEALLSLGDPETLNLDARGELIRAFVRTYGQGGWRGLDIPLEEARRLSHPELAPVIRELWGEGPVNDDVRELLIELIWQGPIEGCADLARAAAIDADWSAGHRIGGVRALVACGCDEILREIGEDMLARPAAWPVEVVQGVVADLFPRVLTVDALVNLLTRTYEQRQSVDGFDRAAREIAEEIEPWSAPALGLRDRIAELIWNGRESTLSFHSIHGSCDHFAPALAVLCNRQLSVLPGVPDPGLIRACVIASRFVRDDSGLHESVGSMRARFREGGVLRSLGFWAELAFMDEIVPATDNWHRLFHAERQSLLGRLTEADRSWLYEALTDQGRADRRGVALEALIADWKQRGGGVADLDLLRAGIAGAADLEAILAERTAPVKPNAELEEMEREIRHKQSARVVREEQRKHDWMSWRAELLADPLEAFSPDKRSATIANLYFWLRDRAGKSSRCNVWDKRALVQAFDADIADRAEAAYRELWRSELPVQWSARTGEARNEVPYRWIQGLCGVCAESSIDGWTSSLSSSEARIAAAYAPLELNAFAPFIVDLTRSYPAEVEAVIGAELSAEFRVGGDHAYLPILNKLSAAAGALKRLLVPRLLDALREFSINYRGEASSRWGHHMVQVLRILREASSEAEREAVAELCSRLYGADLNGPLARLWLKGLFWFDAKRGTQVWIEALKSGSVTSGNAVETFAFLFGDRSSFSFEIADLSERAQALGQLVRRAYTFVRREHDQVREGCYAPNARDDAQAARNFLLSALLDTRGADACRVLSELASEPDFAHMQDRLRLFARRRAAEDAEPAPLAPSDLIALECRYEVPPRSRDELFTVLMDRLDDLQHYIAHDDFSDRRTLQGIVEEAEMQRAIAGRLKLSARGAYVVTREEEVADRKRPDIRIAAVEGDHKAVIEVKIAGDRWTLSALDRALRDQLVGQYLRSTTCQAGCLLLTNNGEKTYWEHPESGERLQFANVITFLREKAQELELAASHRIRLAVFGLDLTDPPLAPVHRK